jgi:hypothetical protein
VRGLGGTVRLDQLFETCFVVGDGSKVANLRCFFLLAGVIGDCKTTGDETDLDIELRLKR